MGNVRIVTNRDIERKLVLFLACLSVCFAESAKSRYHDSVTTVGDADMELDRCVAWTRKQVEFEDRCDTNTL